MSSKPLCQSILRPLGAALVLSLSSIPLFAQHVVDTVSTGSGSTAVAINLSTKKVFVLNHFDNSASIIDPANNDSVTNVSMGTDPTALTIDNTAKKIYVADMGDPTALPPVPGDVTIIDGVTFTTSTLAVGSQNVDIALNPTTGKVYVANLAGTVEEIDAKNSNTVTTIHVGNTPFAVAVNPTTNKIYVANYSNNNVTVIDGVTRSFTTVPVGTNPDGIAVNPNTNKIYVANQNSSNVTVIDGSNNTTTTIPAGSGAESVAINLLTDKIYVANASTNTVTVIDDTKTPATTVTVTVGASPFGVAIDVATNKAYVANNGLVSGVSTVTVIDGANSTHTVSLTGTNSAAVAVNPNTDLIYVANDGSANVTVIDGSSAAGQANVGLSANINPTTPGQQVTFTAAVSASALPAPSGSVTFFDANNLLGNSNISAGTASFPFSSLGAGEHLITAVYSGDANYASSSADISHAVLSAGATGTTTTIKANGSSVSATGYFGTVNGVQGVTLQATVSPAPPAGEQVIFLEGGNQIGAPQALNASGHASMNTNLTIGLHSIDAAYLGDGTDAGSKTASPVKVNQAPRPKPR